MTPKISLMLAQVLSISIVLAALLVTFVFSIVFPEFCTDVVWRGHHEGLEHLLHMAHHTLGSQVGVVGVGVVAVASAHE